MKIRSHSRRSFIKVTAISTGGLYLHGCYNLPGPFYILSAEEALILDALADQIIPPDDFAGGKDAGVTNFIDKQLAGVYSHHTDMYKKCLSGLNQTCIEIYGKEFPLLSPQKQYDYLKDIEAGRHNKIEWEGYQTSAFFNTLINHCLQGYYGHPRHGGNKDYVAYRLMNLDYPLIIGRNVHEKI